MSLVPMTQSTVANNLWAADVTVRALIIGGTPGHPPAAAVLLRDAAGIALSVVETAEVGAAILASQPFEAAVIDIAGDDAPSTAVNALLRAQADLVVVVITETDQAAATLLALGAQEQLTRDDLTRSIMLRAVRHGIARRTFRGSPAGTAPIQAEVPQAPVAAAHQPGGRAVPDLLLAQAEGRPTDTMTAALGHLLESCDLTSAALGDLEQAAGIADGTLSLAERPLGNVMRALIARDLDAQGMLVQGCFERAAPSENLAGAVTMVVRTLASFWGQAPPSVLIATDWGGVDDRVRDLRYQHLRQLSDSALRYLGTHRGEVVHDDPDRALTVAVDQLLAVLDQQLTLGPLHPVDLEPTQVVASFAEQVTVFLRGPRTKAPAPAPAPAPAAARKPAPAPAPAPAAARKPAPAPAATPEPATVKARTPERPGSLFGRPIARSDAETPTFDLSRIRIDEGPRVEEANVRIDRREPALLTPR